MYVCMYVSEVCAQGIFVQADRSARVSASVYEICMHDFRSLYTRMNIHEINVEFVFIFSWLNYSKESTKKWTTYCCNRLR